MTEDDLLQAIREEPDEADNYLVYGDYLAQRGDPRGELIGFQHALASDPDNAELAARVTQLCDAQLATLPIRVHASWKLGFIRDVELLQPQGLDRIPELFAHPLLHVVEGVSAIDRLWMTANPYFRKALDTIVASAPPTLRKLEIGAPGARLFDSVVELQRVLDRFPRLCEFAINQRDLPVGVIEVLAPIAESLELTTFALSTAQLADLAKRAWPKLRKLAIETTVGKHDPKRATPLSPLMTGKKVPRLRDLRVRERGRTGGFTDRFCTEIVRSKLLAQLEVLDFSVVGLDLDAVRPSYPELRHLKRLLPSAERETDVAALEQMAWLLEEPDTERAITLCRRLVGLAKSDHERHNIYRRLGTCLGLLSRLDEALGAHEASLAAEIGCGVTWLQKAWVLKRLGRIDDAAAAIERATTTKQHPASAHRVRYLQVSLGLARGIDVKRTEIAAVRDLYVTELATSAVDADLFYEHACLLALLRDKTGAMRGLAACFDLCPPYKVWARDELDFSSLRKLKAFQKLIV